MNKPETAPFFTIAETGPYHCEMIHDGMDVGIFLADSSIPSDDCFTLAGVADESQRIARQANAGFVEASLTITHAEYLAKGGK
tara:strand:- start:91 stop:339 length:249 start_codon:yes stop_codon:yes gene_type:complete